MEAIEIVDEYEVKDKVKLTLEQTNAKINELKITIPGPLLMSELTEEYMPDIIDQYKTARAAYMIADPDSPAAKIVGDFVRDMGHIISDLPSDDGCWLVGDYLADIAGLIQDVLGYSRR